MQLFHSAQTPKLKSKSGPARIVGLRDNDDCEDFCDSTVQCIRFWRLLGSCRINVKHRVWTGFSFLSRRSASFLSRRSASFLYVTALRFCHVWVFLSFLRRWARPEALIAKLVYIGEINAGQMRLNTYSKTADSAYRDYRASQRAAARRVSLILSGFSISLPVSNSRSYIIQVRRYCESIVSQASGGSGCAPSFLVRIVSRGIMGICFKPLKWGMTFCWAASSVVLTPRAVEEFDVSCSGFCCLRSFSLSFLSGFIGALKSSGVV